MTVPENCRASALIGPNPRSAVRAVSLAIHQALREVQKEAPDTAVIIACSGGADSLALAAAAIDSARRMGLPVATVTVDHGLRPESAAEAAQVAQLCQDLGAPVALVETVTVGRAGGPEAAARKARQAGLSTGTKRALKLLECSDLTGSAPAAQELAPVLLLGHTCDDQAETVLLGLGRGSGLSAVAGMPANGIWEGTLPFLRPLLGLRREQTEGFCQQLGLEYVLDPTNEMAGPWRAADGSALRRAAVRAQALPALAAALGKDPIPALARTADQVQRDQEYLHHQAGQLLRAARAAGHDPHSYQRQVLAQAHPAVRSRALHQAAVAAGASAGGLTANHIAALEELAAATGDGTVVELPGGIRGERHAKLITFQDN